MFDPSGPSQLGSQTRLWTLPSLDQDKGTAWELAPGRVLVARVLEVQGSEAVLAWGRHRFAARSEPPLRPGTTVTLRVQQADEGAVSLRLLETEGEVAATRPDARGELLLALGLVDDGRNRAIIASLARAGLAVTAAGVRAVRQALAQLGATDDDAAAVIWLQQAQLPHSQAALEVARALVQQQPPTVALWQALWSRLAETPRSSHTIRRLATQLPLLRLDHGDPAALAEALRHLVERLVAPTEYKLTRSPDLTSLRLDSRVVLHLLRQRFQREGRLTSELDRALATLADRLEAQQLANAVGDGTLRIDLPLLVDGQLQLATLTVQGRLDEARPADGEPGEARASLEVSLSGLGRIEVELVRRGQRLFCWLSTADERSYRLLQLLQVETSDVVRRLEEATGWSVEARWFLAPPASPAPRGLRPVDVRM